MAMANLLEHTLILAAHGVKRHKTRVYMSLSSTSLQYSAGGTTHTICLYDNVVDVGANYFMIAGGGIPLYVPLGLPTDANASHIRVQKNGSTWAVLSSVSQQQLIANYTIFETKTDVTDEEMCVVTSSSNNIGFGYVLPATVVAAYNMSVTFTATALSGHTFSNWNIVTAFGSSTSTTNPLTITVTSPTRVTANFT
jgi:hypothetical protein